MKKRLADLGFESYDEYLHSSLWRANKARLNLHFACYICTRDKRLRIKSLKGKILHAHHRTYKNLGCEREGDLVVLCQGHHEGLHRFLKTHRVGLAVAHEKYVLYLLGLEYPKKKKVRKTKSERRAAGKAARKVRRDAQGR